jgi:periplasmic divalent cation tolerance protein
MKSGLLFILLVRRMTSSLSAVFITTNSMDSAKNLAKGLVENKLAACVNIIPGVVSVYKWEGQLQEDHEHILMVKTRQELLPQVTDWVKSNHPYTCPEVISLPIQGGNPNYLDFVFNSTLNTRIL